MPAVAILCGVKSRPLAGEITLFSRDLVIGGSSALLTSVLARPLDGAGRSDFSTCVGETVSSGSLLGGVVTGVRSGWVRVSRRVRTRGGAAVAGMFFVQQGEIALGSVLFVAAIVTSSGSMVFYEALLPHVATEETGVPGIAAIRQARKALT
jgi:hypothetical protein